MKSFNRCDFFIFFDAFNCELLFLRFCTTSAILSFITSALSREMTTEIKIAEVKCGIYTMTQSRAQGLCQSLQNLPPPRTLVHGLEYPIKIVKQVKLTGGGGVSQRCMSFYFRFSAVPALFQDSLSSFDTSISGNRKNVL